MLAIPQDPIQQKKGSSGKLCAISAYVLDRVKIFLVDVICYSPRFPHRVPRNSLQGQRFLVHPVSVQEGCNDHRIHKIEV
jgi:hypothetical protein